MAVHNELLRARLDDLFLDPTNPRLGRRNTGPDVSQERVLELMRAWELEELAISFMESGFWPQEALVVHQEPLYGEERLVVLEGNRRLAALKLLRQALEGDPASRVWRDIAAIGPAPEGLFEQIPYLLVDDRSDLVAFLGFRHVTGIKEWSPAEKAEYIGRLIDQQGMGYRDAARRIGTRQDTVRRNYIAYRILMQLEGLEGVSVTHVEERFSVLYLAIREPGVRTFLGLNPNAEPAEAERPVPEDHLDNLRDFATWLFGTNESPPLFSDSRLVGRLGRVLASEQGVRYLRESDAPSFELAVRKAEADQPELMRHLNDATDNLEQALSLIHLYAESGEVIQAVERLGKGFLAILRSFPEVQEGLGLSRDDAASP